MPKRRGYTVRRLRVKGRSGISHRDRANLHRIGGRIGHYKSRIGRILGAGKFHPFPPMLSSVLKTTFGQLITANLAGVKGNAYDIIIPANVITNVGPYINYPLGTLSSEQTNVPSGVYYLLSAEKFDGTSVAPYNRYFVSSCSIRVTMTPNNDTGQANINRPVQVCLIPLSDNAGTIAETMSTNNLMEQENAKRVLVPPSLTSIMKPLKNSLSTQQAFGLKHLDNEDSTYCGTSGAEPQNIWSWVLRLSNTQAATVTEFDMAVEIELTQHVTFFDRNLMTSSTIGLGGATGAVGTYELHPSTGATGSNFAYITGEYNPFIAGGADQTFIPN